MNRWVKLVLLVLAAVVAAELVVRGVDRRPQRLDDSIARAAAPEAPELRLRTLSGEEMNLEHLRGRVVAVNFWASWCGPCLAEMPELAKLWNDHQGRCFELLGVAAESARTDAERRARGIPYPILFDADGRALDAWDVRGFPRTFLLDPDGRVRRVFPGMVSRETLAEAIEPLLPGSCPDLR
jgi:cytochrome c biogenesis protein CcmG/thiol:disulfide interchange protein DsbE